MNGMKTFDIITLFPESVSSYIRTSLLERAAKKKLLRIRAVNLRDFAEGRHKTTDLPPYGGGPGMVLKPEPIWRAVQKSRSIDYKTRNKKTRIILFSLRGKKLTQKEAKRLARYDHLIFICGRYEGVDERVAKYLADEEISIGDYVLSGGELPALVTIEAVARNIKGFLGKTESLEDIKGSYPVYTRPPVFKTKNLAVRAGKKGKMKEMKVPKVLMSGNHAAIKKWRNSVKYEKSQCTETPFAKKTNVSYHKRDGLF